jgi:uncharacterized delta-60 repeat protein
MSTVDPIAAILADLDRPATVRQEFADALLSRLLAELTAPAPGRALIARPARLYRGRVARVTGPQQTTTTWLPRWQWRRGILAFALVVVGVVVTGSALATLGYHPLGGLSAPAGHRHGSLDTSFGGTGKVTTPIGPRSGVSALAIRKDGKLVAAGSSVSNNGSDSAFALVRYHANGTLDGSFGRSGKVTTPIGSRENGCFGGGYRGAVASALAIQQDGNLAAAGRAAHGFCRSDFALARYHANGTLDGSFGRGGKVTTSIGPNAEASALAIRKDGKLVAAGWSDNGSRFALVRYNANGTLDTSFGRGGSVTTPIGPNAGAAALAIQQDGKLLAAGSSSNNDGSHGVFALVRYHANGTLDTSFGRGGKVTTPGFYGGALAIQQDGKLVAAGSNSNNDGSHGVFALVRYHANGTLDRSFGRGGKVTTPGFYGGALVIQQDGKLVAAGRSALVRYHANGTLDTSFGRGGKVTTPIGVAALAIQQDGKLVVAGGSNNRFALVRYWP